QELLHLRGGVLVDKEPTPHLRLMRPARVPDGNRAWLARQQRGVGENLSGRTDKPAAAAGAPTAPLLLAMTEIFGDLGRILRTGGGGLIFGQYIKDRLVTAIGNADMETPADHPFRQVAPALATRPDADEIDRPVADIVVGVAAEVLRREFPVARD